MPGVKPVTGGVRERVEFDVDGNPYYLDVRSGAVWGDGPAPQAAYTEAVPPPRSPRLVRKPTNISMSPGGACNFECRYCAARMARERGTGTMDRETVDLVFENYPQMDAMNVCPEGEPAFFADLTRYILDRVAAMEDRGQEVEFGFGTNGMMDLETVKHRALDYVVVSIDGPQPVHDANRPTITGEGTHAEAVAALEAYQRAGARTGIRMTLTSAYTDYRSLLIYGHELADYVSALPVIPTPGDDQCNRAPMLEGYVGLADLFLEKILAGDARWNYAIRHCALGAMFCGFLARWRTAYPCRAGEVCVAVSPDRKVHGCALLLHSPELAYCDLGDEIPPEIIAEHCRRHVDRIPECAACWLRYQCGGPCYFRAYRDTGDIYKPGRGNCDFYRGIAEIALRMVVRLWNESPEIATAYRDSLRNAGGARLDSHWFT